MGSEGIRAIIGGHFGKYGIRRGEGNNGTGPNHLHSSLSPTEATSSTPTSQAEHQYSTSYSLLHTGSRTRLKDGGVLVSFFGSSLAFEAAVP